MVCKSKYVIRNYQIHDPILHCSYTVTLGTICSLVDVLCCVVYRYHKLTKLYLFKNSLFLIISSVVVVVVVDWYEFEYEYEYEIIG